VQLIVKIPVQPFVTFGATSLCDMESIPHGSTGYSTSEKKKYCKNIAKSIKSNAVLCGDTAI
jgi:hypothetical protein